MTGAGGRKPAQQQAQATTVSRPPTLALESFLPYRLSVLTNRVSRGLARTYAERFGLSVPEWRVLAVLGRFPNLSANEVAERSAMDKVMVSRAVARLLRAGLLTRESDRRDRRRSVLTFTATGAAVYGRIVPLALAYQENLLAALSADEVAALDRLIAKLDRRVAAGAG
jgi:DNA-binding MarR family transcriptional regulator